jgi:hypothetical protein
MAKQRNFKSLFGSRKGGIGAIIAMIVSIILVLGLIAYTVLGQVAGAKDTGDRAQIEQDKINQMLQDPSIVTGNVVENYYNQSTQGGYKVSITQPDSTTTLPIEKVVDGALFQETKSYDANGKLATISFKQINLSRSN